MGTTALCSSKMPCDILPFTRRVCVFNALSLSLTTWVATHTCSPLSAGLVCCKVLVMSGANSHSSFSSSGTSNLPALLRIKSTSAEIAPRFLPKPRLTSQCDSISRVQDSKGQIFKLTPSAPQGGSTDQKEHRRKICCSFNCLLCNEHTGASFAVASFTGI